MQARILIVDDDPQIRTLLSEFLERYGFACQTAANGDEMWRVLDDGKSLANAEAEAKTVGLKSPDYLSKAQDYISRSLKPKP